MPTPQRGSFMYSFTNSNELSWKIDMYVSCSETGQVDPATDVIDGPNLQWVGAVLYDNWFKDWQATIDVKIQTRYTNIRTRLDTSYMTPITKNGMTIGYKVPLTGVTALFENADQYWLSDRRPVYHSTDNAGLPTEAEQIKSWNYKEKVQDIVESNDFMSQVLGLIDTRLGGNYALVDKVLSLTQGTQVEKRITDLVNKGLPNTEILNALLPTSDNCVVEWVAVVTPMFAWSAKPTTYTGNDFTCWEYAGFDSNVSTTEASSLRLLGSYSGQSVRIGLDAHEAAQLNATTRMIFRRDELAEFYSNNGITITTSMAEDYAKDGKLRTEYRPANYEAIASCAHDIHDIPVYCGVYTSADITSWSSDANMAIYGGITVYKSDLDEDPSPSIPVYYYITPDPNEPTQTDPKSVPVDKPFTPNPPAGTKVKKVVIPNKPLPGSNPPQHFPTDEQAVSPSSDGTYPIEPDNPPYILVECEQTALPVYYHVFTFTNTTGNKYKDVFEFLSKNPKLSESDASEVITCKETVKPLADDTTAYYKPDPDYADGGVIVAALSTSTTANGSTWSSIINGISDGRYDPTISTYYAPERSTWSNPMKQALSDDQSVTYAGKTFTKNATRSIHVKVYTLADSEPTTGTERDTDRIKTYDVTQFIVVDGNSTSHIRITDKTNKEFSAEEDSFSVPNMVMFELDREGKSEESGSDILRRLRGEIGVPP